MIYDAFLAPSEMPPRLIEIKRALLTFDKVLIPDPADRDLIPPQSFATLALGLPPIFGIDTGPVRPIGKVERYDENFGRVVEECKKARTEGMLEVVSSYQRQETMTIGAVLMGDYPLNPQAMLLIYRTMARDNAFLLEAIEGDSSILEQSDDYIRSIALGHCRADGKINEDPATPLIDGAMKKPELRDELTQIARARLAATIKAIGYCAAKSMVPFFSDTFYQRLVRKIVSGATKVVDDIAAEDPYWANRSLALRVAHEEYIDEFALDQMSLSDVIKLRTHAWGVQSNARDDMLQSVAEMCKEIHSEKTFEAECKTKIHAYHLIAGQLESERERLNFRVKCDVGISVGAGAGYLLVAGSIAQMQTAFGAATALLAGCVYALKKIKDYAPVAAQLRQAEKEFKDSVSFGLHQFYRNISS